MRETNTRARSERFEIYEREAGVEYIIEREARDPADARPRRAQTF